MADRTVANTKEPAATMASHIDSIHPFLAQYRAGHHLVIDDPNDPWLTHPAFHSADDQPFPPHRRPASSGKATSRYSVASSSTEQTLVTSVFSAPEPAAGPTNQAASQWTPNPAEDHPDLRELSDQELTLLHHQAAPPDPALLASHRMPCEFARYTGCAATFDAFTQVESWILHELQDHLGWEPPPTCLCWFCDDYKFVTALTGHGDNKENFRSRMVHIADHFKEEGTVNTRGIRPDFFFLDYLWEKGMVSRDVFEREKGVHEAVQVEGLRPRGYRTRRVEREEERRGGVIVDARKEERERKKEVRRARDKG